MEITIDGILLAEAKVKNGVIPVKIIKPGWGSSGYYSQEVLRRDAHLFEGAHMYWNHPKASEEWERPERDLNDFSGVLEKVRWDDNGSDGPGIYGTAKVFKPYMETVEAIGEYIGLSIRALGQGRQGEAEGRSGVLIESITEVRSVDFVTRAGAGGKVLAQFNEAANSDVKSTTLQLIESEDNDMDLKEALEQITTQQTQLTEANATIITLNETIKAHEGLIAEQSKVIARFNEAELVNECTAIVAEELKEAELPEITKERILGEASKFMAFAKKDDGEDEDKKKLDKKKVKENVQEAIKQEGEYLSKLTGGVSVRGMGAADSSHIEARESEAVTSDMQSAFMAMGFSESQAKTAAAGK